MDNDKNKKIILVLVILTVIFTIIGGSLAYFSWISSEAQKTNIVFTVERTFSCAADGGGSITNNSAIIVPTLVNSNTTGNYIKREVKVTPTINQNGKTIYMDLWLDINKLDSGLSNSVNFKYAFTTSSTSNTTEVIASGNFNGKKAGNKIRLLDSETFSASDTSTYYLWIWLDANETSSDTMDQSFSLSLNGSCTDAIPVEPNAPDLDDGMIPVVISDTGITKTISKDDTSWYNYKKKQWANVVLVNSSSRSKYLNTSGVTVSETDILAYYVWIPRYKYKIWSVDNDYKKGKEQEIQIVFENKNDVAYVPNVNIYASCASVENPNFVDYPECYGAPYSVTTEEKQKLITWWHSFISAEMNTSYTLEQATTDVNEVMIKGSVIPQGLPEDAIIDFPLMIDIYNEDENNTDQITPTGIFIGTNETTSLTVTSDTPEIGDYITHPAFWWDNNSDRILEQSEILNGIWVGKFETAGTANTPTIKPNVKSLTSQNVSTQFATSQKLGTSTYGLTSKVDAHMMKNSEWGAVAYLSHSKYGVNREIYINNSSGYYTGRSGGNVGGSTAVNTVYTDRTETRQDANPGFYTWDGYLLEYNTQNKTTTHDISKVASTTGNITGVYDISGGTAEYVMGVFANSNGTLWSGYATTFNSGFTGLVGRDGGSYTGVDFPDSKYYDVYKAANGTLIDPLINTLTACDGGICYGHGLSEVNRWYADSGFFINANFPWFIRGGGGNGSGAGAFSFDRYYGVAIGSGFRSVVSFVGA